MMRRKKERIIN
jgi:hypothetical protein